MLTFLAHSGEEHTDVVASSTHYLQEWYIAIPAAAIVVFMIAYLTWLVSNRNKNTTLGVITFTLLILGLLGFALSPAVSIIAILLGMGFALFAAFTSLLN